MTELQSIVCNGWHTDNDVQEISLFSLKLDTRKRQYNNGPGRTDSVRPGPARSDDISARARPVKICKFQAKARPVLSGIPWLRRSLIRYNLCEQIVNTNVTCSSKFKLPENITPRNLAILTVSMLSTAKGMWDLLLCPKSHFLKIQDVGGRYLEKYTKGQISANSWSICTRFRMLEDTGNISVTKGPKCHFSEIQDGGGRHLGKYTKGPIWANSWPIYTKFGVVIDTGNTSVIKGPKCHFLEIQNGGGRHVRKYTKGHISANSWSICTKFDTMIDMVLISVIGG